MKIMITCFILGIFLLSCSSNTDPNVHGFKAIQFVNGKQTSITFNATKIRETEILNVYVQDGFSISSQYIDDIINKFEASYQNTINIFGNHTDLDKNKKIKFIFFDINNGEQDGTFIAGYFNPADLFTDEGNNGEILYIDAVNIGNSDDTAATMIHELQHLINFNMNKIRLQRSSEIWINEALSETSDILHRGGEMPSYRLNAYNRQSTGNQSIALGNYFYQWDSTIEDTATASLFMYWLYIQNSKNSSIIKDIAFSKNSFNYKSIEEVAKNKLGLNNWDDILSTWVKANYSQDSLSLEGYKDNIKLSTKAMTLNNDMSLPLPPGSAVLVANPSQNLSSVNKYNQNIQIKEIKPSIWMILNKNIDSKSTPIIINIPKSDKMIRNMSSNNISLVENVNDIKSDYKYIHLSQDKIYP